MDAAAGLAGAAAGSLGGGCVEAEVRRRALLALAADAHTTHDKPHAAGALIRAHHNATLANISSFGPRVTLAPVADVKF